MTKPDALDERELFEAFMLTREAPSSAKHKLAPRDGDEYLHPHVARHWYTWQQACQSCRASIKPVIPDGWQLVPIEPTHEMISAMSCSEAIDDEGKFPALMDLIDFSGENKTHSVLKAAYAAMLAAAPTPPQKESS